ncbi:hypothetical protein [Embleya sp. NBC_00896]|uniref:hypothetical protein n=1 Tax=Embleya sp. NBC_00896 TaxID=2975961 RepID=UPI00386AB7CF|nr:hypothetical protein OG928_00580 [Embleya sp. NBC_00896]
MAARLDEATERIVGYLADLEVPVNAVFFHYYEDDGHRYLARTWLRDEAKAAPARVGKSSTREPWNGVDWYSAFGERVAPGRGTTPAGSSGSSPPAATSGSPRACAGRARGDRVDVYTPKVGYVGVGEVWGEPAPFTEAVVGDGSVRLAEQQLVGNYRHVGDETDPDVAENVLPVRWLKTVDRGDSVTAKGIFALQHPMCRLSNAATLAILNAEFFPERTTT